MEQAIINGLELDIETIEDSFEKSIVKYEFPYKDGALLEDLGQKARIIKIRCYFFGERYELHKELINRLKNQDIIELLHPKYGLILGAIESINIRHDERIRTAEIDITFIENLRGEPQSIHHIEIDQAMEDFFIEGQSELVNTIKEKLSEKIDNSILNKELDPLKNISEQVPTLNINTKNYLKSIDRTLTSMQALFNEINIPANSIINIIDYSANIPGRIISVITTLIERYALAYQSLINSPQSFMINFSNSINELAGKFNMFSKEIKTSGSLRMALALAYIYAIDQEKRKGNKKLEKTPSFDINGYFKGKANEPILTINEIEKSLYIVRKNIQECVNINRKIPSLKKIARVLLEYTNTIKLEREKIKKIYLDRALPIHLVCLKHDLPYSSAERILSINNIPNPNIVSGEINIYAR